MYTMGIHITVFTCYYIHEDMKEVIASEIAASVILFSYANFSNRALTPIVP